MAGTSLLTLIDDIATLLDDVAVMTKVATQRTAGLLGDDLAVNAEQVTGVAAERELPVVAAVAKGSAINKAILVPAALLISVIAPWAVTPLLMAGGTFLCFEGFEKVHEKLFHRGHASEPKGIVEIAASLDIGEYEKAKVKGAIRTDFILSAEIIVITLGTIPEGTAFGSKVAVLCAIAAIMTIGVYGFVAAIVKIDDVGFALVQKGGGMAKVGHAIVAAAPWLMKGLGVVGTIAMFLVGGELLVHGITPLETWLHSVLPSEGTVGTLAKIAANGTVGFLAGALTFFVIEAGKKLRGSQPAH